MPADHSTSADRTVPPWVWSVSSWAFALGVFAVAMIKSCQATSETLGADLRSPAVLLLNFLLAAAVAFGFAARESALRRWGDLLYCFRFGLWSAAVFRMVPPIINECVVYDKRLISFDAPYVVLGACIHGGLAMLLAWPYAIRVLYPEGRPLWTANESIWEMCGAAILIFFIVAGAVRLTVGVA